MVFQEKIQAFSNIILIGVIFLMLAISLSNNYIIGLIVLLAVVVIGASLKPCKFERLKGKRGEVHPMILISFFCGSILFLYFGLMFNDLAIGTYSFLLCFIVGVIFSIVSMVKII